MKIKAACFGVFMVLSGCSSEENVPGDGRNSEAGKPSANSGMPPVNQAPTTVGSAVENEERVGQEAPTRSELRVLSEDAKAIEEHAQDVIVKFNNDLSDRENRKAAEAEFKQMLPEYKEKMLQLGKAKLKEGNN